MIDLYDKRSWGDTFNQYIDLSGMHRLNIVNSSGNAIQISHDMKTNKGDILPGESLQFDCFMKDSDIAPRLYVRCATTGQTAEIRIWGW